KPMVLLDPSLENMNKPVIVLEGLCASKGSAVPEKIIHSFQKHGLEKIVLAFAAQHEQYPKSVTSNPLPSANDLGLRDHLDFADVEGFSQVNPDIFLIKHVYCDLLSNQLETKI